MPLELVTQHRKAEEPPLYQCHVGATTGQVCPLCLGSSRKSDSKPVGGEMGITSVLFRKPAGLGSFSPHSLTSSPPVFNL